MKASTNFALNADIENQGEAAAHGSSDDLYVLTVDFPGPRPPTDEGIDVVPDLTINASNQTSLRGLIQVLLTALGQRCRRLTSLHVMNAELIARLQARKVARLRLEGLDGLVEKRLHSQIDCLWQWMKLLTESGIAIEVIVAQSPTQWLPSQAARRCRLGVRRSRQHRGLEQEGA